MVEGVAWVPRLVSTRGTAWRQQLFPTRGALVIALFVCVAAPTILGALQIHANPGFSPIDEGAHFDYVDRVARGEVPRQGQLLLKSTFREIACRKFAFEGQKLPPCSARTLAPSQFPYSYQYEAQQPPTYYALTVPMRWVAKNAFGIRNKLDATRATNIVWLVTGLLLAWAAGRIMRIGALPLGAALLLLTAAPIVVYGTGTVTNDVTAIPAAGLVALVAALADRHDGPHIPTSLFLAGFAAAACKATNLLPVVVLSAAFAVAAITRRASAERWTTTVKRWRHDGGALLLGGAISAGTWLIVHRGLSLIDLKDEPSFENLRGTPRTVGVALREAKELFEPLTASYVSGNTLGQDVQAPLHAVLAVILLSAALAGLFVSPRRWSHVVGLIAVPALYVGGVVFGVGLMINYQIDPGISGRYGLSLAPLLILVLAASLSGRWSQRMIAGFAVTMFLTTFAVMVT